MDKVLKKAKELRLAIEETPEYKEYIKNKNSLENSKDVLELKENIANLKAKGKYVHSLDSDDMMCSENYLQILYDEAEKGHYKFIQAKALYVDLNSKIITNKNT